MNDEYPQKGQNNLLVPIAIIVAGMLVAAAIYFSGGHGPVTGSLTGNSRPAKIELPKVTSKDHIRGSLNAPVIIVEYSDTECPYCKVFHQTMKDIMTTYGDKVAWVYREFPIASLHSKAPHEAEALECAAELGGNSAFWSFLDKIFETTNSNDSLDPTQLPKIASSIGLDTSAFNTCLSSGRYTKFVTDSVKEAINLGAEGTPYSVIVAGDKQDEIMGALPIEQVKAKIDALIEN